MQGADSNGKRRIGSEPRETADLPPARDAERNAELERAYFVAFEFVAVPILATAAIVATIIRQEFRLGESSAGGSIVHGSIAPHLRAADGNRAGCGFSADGEIRRDVGIILNVEAGR